MLKPPCIIAPVLLGAAIFGCGGEDETARLQAEREEAFQESMRNVVLEGFFTVTGREDGGRRRPERYEISSISHIAGDLWTFNSRIQYGDHDVTAPVPVKLVWADDTPMVSLTDLTIPGLGEGFTARVLFYEDQYAGMWGHGEVRGNMFGRILRGPDASAEVWLFDSLETLGGHTVEVEGDPQLIETPLGPAIEFDGDDALFLDVHPLSGAEQFTWEVVFRPDSGGGEEQRIFHLQEEGSETRLLFETRLTPDGWYLDAFANSGESKALIVPEKLHPLDEWHHIAQVYDGSEYRSYVDGELQMSAPLKLEPQGPGRTSLGVRINRVDYFKGAFQKARFTRRALQPDELWR